MPSAGIITRFTLILLALGGPGPTANSVRCQGGRADERVDEAGPPVPAELLSRQPEQSGQSGSPADLRTVNTLTLTAQTESLSRPSVSTVRNLTELTGHHQ